jgi:hypothetical protein
MSYLRCGTYSQQIVGGVGGSCTNEISILAVRLNVIILRAACPVVTYYHQANSVCGRVAWTDEPAEMWLEGIISSNVLHDRGSLRVAYPVFKCTLAFALQWRKLTTNLR